MITLSARDPIFKLVTEHPEVINIMVKLGFTDITKPGMLQTVGRFMTLSKGAKMKQISWETVANEFRAHGYELAEEEL